MRSGLRPSALLVFAASQDFLPSASISAPAVRLVRVLGPLPSAVRTLAMRRPGLVASGLRIFRTSVRLSALRILGVHSGRKKRSPGLDPATLRLRAAHLDHSDRAARCSRCVPPALDRCRVLMFYATGADVRLRARERARESAGSPWVVRMSAICSVLTLIGAKLSSRAYVRSECGCVSAIGST